MFFVYYFLKEGGKILKKTLIFQIVILFLFLPIAISENSGILTGTVVDSLNNLVGNVDVQVYCGSSIISGKTDEYGTFIIRNLPSGSCKAYAKYKDAIGFSNIVINSNETKEISIVLDKTIIDISKANNNYLVWILVVFLIVLIILFLTKNKKFKNILELKGQKLKKREHKNKISISKIDTLLKALSQRERQIIEALITHNGETTQAKIRYDTNIPKASLSRHIKNLEQKKIIEVKRIGKVSKIRLLEK